jgi:hypothetical protein
MILTLISFGQDDNWSTDWEFCECSQILNEILIKEIGLAYA